MPFRAANQLRSSPRFHDEMPFRVVFGISGQAYFRFLRIMLNFNSEVLKVVLNDASEIHY